MGLVYTFPLTCSATGVCTGGVLLELAGDAAMNRNRGTGPRSHAPSSGFVSLMNVAFGQPVAAAQTGLILGDFISASWLCLQGAFLKEDLPQRLPWEL